MNNLMSALRLVREGAREGVTEGGRDRVNCEKERIAKDRDKDRQDEERD